MQFLFLDSSASTKYSEEIQHWVCFFYCFTVFHLFFTSNSTHYGSYPWIGLVGAELEVRHPRPIQHQELQWQDKGKWLHIERSRFRLGIRKK